ncbi:MAG: sodium:calcium antiporter [Candidatus Bilamarchaeaceae archaeon]
MFFLDLALLLFFIFVLSKTADFAVENAVKISSFIGLSKLAVGLFLVSVLTTLPEFTVSVLSSLAGAGEIAAGNVFGSVVTNLILVLGFSGVLHGVQFSKNEIKEVFIAILLIFAISVYVLFGIFLKDITLDWIEGVGFLFVFIFYFTHFIKKKSNEHDLHVGKKEVAFSFIIFVFSIIGVILSSNLCVEYALKIVEESNLSSAFIGLTIISIGTSLPELSVILQAAKRKEYGVAVGNSIGSSIINITFILGASSIIRPLALHSLTLIIGVIFSIIAAVFLLYFGAHRQNISRGSGLIFLLCYLFFLVLLFYSNNYDKNIVI